MKRFLVVLFLLFGALFAWLYSRRSAPPETPFVKVRRETLVSTLTTNGKVEPIEYANVRAEREGTVLRVPVQRGQHVNQGDLLAELDARDAQADLVAAQARIAQAQAQLEIVQRGGRSGELAEIESGLNTARAAQQNAQRELDTTKRLSDKGAATKAEVNTAQQALDQARLQIEALDRRRAALVGQTDRSVAEAQLREARTAAETAQRRIQLAEIRSPISGTLYQFDLRPGLYLNPGDLVGAVGRLNQVRVTLYVDEPELGRVSTGLPVKITWDALPGRSWTGSVEKVPTQVVPLGTRQVGEVTSIIDNNGGQLLPGTNVNAELRTQVVQNALTIPRESLRRENNQTGVYLLGPENRIAWHVVSLGASSVARAQIMSGVGEGDSVALPTDRPLHVGDIVTPVYPGR